MSRTPTHKVRLKPFQAFIQGRRELKINVNHTAGSVSHGRIGSSLGPDLLDYVLGGKGLWYLPCGLFLDRIWLVSLWYLALACPPSDHSPAFYDGTPASPPPIAGVPHLADEGEATHGTHPPPPRPWPKGWGTGCHNIYIYMCVCVLGWHTVAFCSLSCVSLMEGY